MENEAPKIVKQIKATPFLRWAGGKKWFLKYLTSLDCCHFNNYFEPFLGGGAVFFHIDSYDSAYLSDLNPDLIEAYSCVKEQLENVVDVLSTFRNTETQYYLIREREFSRDYERAAKFIYLNKTSFNGIYRVNRQGKYNVPYGFKKNVDLINLPNLQAVQGKLTNVTLNCDNFDNIADRVNAGDFIFLDPPYTVAHENNGFIAYNQKLFSLQDQHSLAGLIEIIIERGAFYVLTNAKHDAVKEIYARIGQPTTLTRSSTIGGAGARRETFKEYIFTNCPLT